MADKSRSVDRSAAAPDPAGGSVLRFLRSHYYKIAGFLSLALYLLRYIPGSEDLGLHAFTELSYRNLARTGSYLKLTQKF